MLALFAAKQPILSNTIFQIGAPLPRGAFFANQQLMLRTGEKHTVPCAISIVSFWPDQSIKWLNVLGKFDHDYEENTQFHLQANSLTKQTTRRDWVVHHNNCLLIDTKHGQISLDTEKFAGLQLAEQVVEAEFECKINSLSTNIDTAETRYEVVFDQNNEPLICKIMQKAIAFDTAQKKLNLSLHLDVYFMDGQVHARLDMHNPAAIKHDNGQWDLGNEQSVIINTCGLKFNFRADKKRFQLTEFDRYSFFDRLELRQISSGGKNWNSENHKTKNNRVELTHKGAIGESVCENKKTEISIDRAQPRLLIELKDKRFHLIPHHFWEKYPSSLRCDDAQARLNFATDSAASALELQAGEIKSHTLVFGLNADDKTPSWSAHADLALSIDNLIDSHALPLSKELFVNHPLMGLLLFNNAFTKAWISKREMVDEYGWRNFGDLYADHEAAEFTGDGIFVSHYNNQYDPLLGFLKQWLLTASYDYKMLADDLFEHIVNIDIYHTEYDKPEYNRGLFWHTDHYVPAETASHRTYSKHQETGVYIDHAGGGGPGAHHCYSSGLALYYLMSKDKRALSAVTGLGEWMSNIYEGDGTILNLVLRIKNANHLRLPFSQKLLLGHGHGTVRNVFTNKYPLDRGTGNYVNCLLDCFEVSARRKYLKQAEFVITNTITPHDDFSERNFDDVENTWFYTVFLQSVIKYLGIMFQLKAETSQSKVIRESLLHYANYIADNEQPYLLNPEILEYPNDTWTGQDLRKIHILYCAYKISEKDKMLTKAQELADYVYPKLLASEESVYTRIQALIMQNMSDLDSASSLFNGYGQWLKTLSFVSLNKDSDGLQKANYLKRLVKFVKNYSIKKECRLLLVRVPQLSRLLKK